MNEENRYSRQLAYEQRQRESGLTRAGVWVPERDVERLRNYAAKLRRAYEKEIASAETSAETISVEAA